MSSAADFVDLEPVSLIDKGDGEWSVVLDTTCPEAQANSLMFEDYELEGTGFDWSAAVQAALLEDNDTIADDLTFEPEQSQVVITGGDLRLLYLAGETLAAMLSDDEQLARGLRLAEEAELLD